MFYTIIHYTITYSNGEGGPSGERSTRILSLRAKSANEDSGFQRVALKPICH